MSAEGRELDEPGGRKNMDEKELWDRDLQECRTLADEEEIGEIVSAEDRAGKGWAVDRGKETTPSGEAGRLSAGHTVT